MTTSEAQLLDDNNYSPFFVSLMSLPVEWSPISYQFCGEIGTSIKSTFNVFHIGFIGS